MKPESYASRKMADAWDRGYEDALDAAAEFIGGHTATEPIPGDAVKLHPADIAAVACALIVCPALIALGRHLRRGLR